MKWLEVCLDWGISEYDFWNMTMAELTRLIESKQRVMLNEAKEKAMYDYTLADLIGRSLSRLYSSSAKMPPISEVYPSLFDAEKMEEELQAKKDELSILRLKQFAQSHNQKFKKGDNK